MATDTLDSLLSAIGFGASDATNQFGMIDRQRQLAESNANFQGDVNRRNLIAGQEGNGVLSSGETGQKLADLGTAQANDLAGIDLNAADQAGGVQRQLLKDKASADATALQQAQQSAQFDASQQFSQTQLGQQTDLYNQQRDLQAQAAGFDPYAYLRSLGVPTPPAPDPQSVPAYQKPKPKVGHDPREP